jgi:hypothetical protein
MHLRTTDRLHDLLKANIQLFRGTATGELSRLVCGTGNIRHYHQLLLLIFRITNATPGHGLMYRILHHPVSDLNIGEPKHFL